MRRTLVLGYGIAAYGMFLGVFLYAVGFIGNFLTPTSLDGPRETSLGFAVGMNLLLLSLFALQHSGMARPAFKRWWTQIVPPEMERSTYVVASNLAMIIMFWLWQPMGMSIWNVEGPIGQTVLYGLFAIGWGTVLVSTLLLNHFELFGLRQVWLAYTGRPYTSLPFAMPSLYRLVRHPLYVGWLLVSWATPTMTAAHLLFAMLVTAYILIAIQLEERDLVRHHGLEYAEYRRNVPMLIPRFGRQKMQTSAADLAAMTDNLVS